MEKNFVAEFKLVCEKDINSILNQIYALAPEIKDWKFYQSIILDENKKILYKTLNNKFGNKIGTQIDIDIMLDTMYSYNFKCLKDLISFTKCYEHEGKQIKEEKIISLKGDTVNRFFSYSENDKSINYSENYNLRSKKGIINDSASYCYDLNYQSIDNIMENLKKEFHEKPKTRLKRR